LLAKSRRKRSPRHHAPRHTGDLVTLYDLQNRVQSRQQILADVWGIESDIELRTVDTHMKRLREKLGSGSAGRYLQTVRGVVIGSPRSRRSEVKRLAVAFSWPAIYVSR